MIPRTSIFVLWLLAATAAIAQDPVPTSTSISLNPSTTPTSTASSVTVSTEPTPGPITGPGSTSESAEYYPSTPGQSYGSDNTGTDSTDGATGKSDNFIDIPLGAQIGIISAVVVVGVAGVIGCVLWYLRRRRQWELDVRRSTIPKLAVNSRGEFTVGTNGDIPVRAPKLRAPSSSADSFDDLALEKGNVKSEFDSESTKTLPFWRKLSPFSKK